MSKPIKLTAELLRKITEEFVSNVKNMKMSDGKLSYTKKFEWNDDDKATVIFSAMAFAKMTMLVQTFDSEVAWHGVAYRDEEVQNRFYITDIMVYPQEVSGSTVNTDQQAYTQWLYSFDDDTFNNIRMQGHSHVTFATNPSGVDTTHQEKILEQLGDDMFYIFMIWNKKFEHYVKIYDMKNNTLYETADCTVLIGEDGVDLAAFIEDAKKSVVKKVVYQTPYYQYQKPATVPPQNVNAATAGVQQAKGKDKQKPKEKQKEKPNIGKRKYNYDVDDDDYGRPYPYGGYSDEYYQ